VLGCSLAQFCQLPKTTVVLGSSYKLIIFNSKIFIHSQFSKWLVYLCHVVNCRSSSAPSRAKRKLSEVEPRNVTELADAISIFTQCQYFLHILAFKVTTDQLVVKTQIPWNVREFCSLRGKCPGIDRNSEKCQENVGGKSCVRKLFVADFTFTKWSLGSGQLTSV